MSHGWPWLHKAAIALALTGGCGGETRRAVMAGPPAESALLGDVLAARLGVSVETVLTFDRALIQRSLIDSAAVGDAALLYLADGNADVAGLCRSAALKQIRLTIVAERAPAGCDALVLVLPRALVGVLAKAVAASHPDAPAGTVIARVKGGGVRLEGPDERRRRGLLGQPANSSGSVPLKVMSIDRGGGLVQLNGGLAMGLASGCVVKRTEPRDAPSLRLEVASAVWSTAEAWVSEGGGINNVGLADVYELEHCPDIR